jgi:hypothetical protein
MPRGVENLDGCTTQHEFVKTSCGFDTLFEAWFLGFLLHLLAPTMIRLVHYDTEP